MLPFLSPRDLPDAGIESAFPALQADSLPSEPEKPINLYRCACIYMYMCMFYTERGHKMKENKRNTKLKDMCT